MLRFFKEILNKRAKKKSGKGGVITPYSHSAGDLALVECSLPIYQT